MNQIVVYLLIAAIPLVAAALLWVLAKAANYLSLKKGQSVWMAALYALDQMVADVVRELNQTVVADLKEKNADGKLTPDEAQQIKNKAIDLILSRLKVDSIQVLSAIFGSIVELIGSKIEATVWDTKKPVPFSPAGLSNLAGTGSFK